MSRRDNNQASQQMTYDIYVGNVPKTVSEVRNVPRVIMK